MIVRAFGMSLVAALCLSAGAALAEFAKVSDAATFKQLITGKQLVRPLVRLELSPEGQINGTGVTWDVTGNWSWREGYFCRDLNWGGSDLGYNCQEVAIKDGRIRFISDKGQGDYADFRLNPVD